MTAEQRDAFLSRPLIAVVTTLREDGAPTSVPIWFEWDGTHLRFFSGRDAGKLARIQRDPRVTVTIAAPATEPEAWVTIEGRAEVTADGALDLARRLAPAYYGPGKASDVVPAWEALEDYWALVTVIPERIQSGAPES